MSVRVNQSEMNDLLLCSFRYALGRRSCITQTIADLIIKFEGVLTDYSKEIIFREITKAFDENKGGMQCDVEEWFRVYKHLRGINE